MRAAGRPHRREPEATRSGLWMGVGMCVPTQSRAAPRAIRFALRKPVPRIVLWTNTSAYSQVRMRVRNVLQGYLNYDPAMPFLQRIRVTWTGQTGLPGISTFYAGETDSTAVAALVTYFGNIDFGFPSSTNWEVPASGDLIDVESGELGGTWSQTGSAVVPGTGGAVNYAAGVGCRVRWHTSGLVNGRRLVGSTFLTGMAVLSYGSDGTIDTSTLTQFRAHATTLVTTSALHVWSPPFAGSPTVPERLGSSAIVQSATMPDKVTSLRSSRN